MKFLNPTTSPAGALRRVAAVTLCAAAAALALATSPARAVIGTTDHVPAATLLLPYFEVDLNDPNGTQTSFTVVNTDRNPTSVKVTLWTDYAVPSYHFDMYVGGRDTVEVDLGLLFKKGVLPQTGEAIGAAGPLSGAHVPIPGCSAVLPPPGLLPAALLDHLQKAHTGQASTQWGGLCGGAVLGDAIVRGYVTIDSTNACTSSVGPTDPGYFIAAGAGVASNKNILIGETKQINRNTKLTITEPLVSIEASSISPVTTTYDLNPPGPVHDVRTAYTFYGRFVANAADQREPLGSIYSGRLLNGGAFTTGTTVTVWRDFDRAPGQQGLPFACNTPPAPMAQRTMALFDEQERAYFPGGQPGVVYSQPLPGFKPNVFPRATQRVHSSTMNTPPFGWLYVDLNNGDLGEPYVGRGARQAFVSVQHLATGKFGGSLPAKSLFNVSEWAFRAGTTGCCGPQLFQPSFPNMAF